LPFTKQDDAVSKLREQLISFARSIASAPKTSGTGSLAPVLLESSFNIARMSTTLLDRISDFGALTAEIAIEWPRFGEEVRPIIQRLCEELPAGQTTELWRLNLRLRTE
jgi:hypothetical protein